MKYKQFYSLFVLCLVGMLLILPGCDSSEALAPKEPVKITFLYFGDATYYEDLVKKFNETYPYITVELTSWNNVRFDQGMPDADVWMDSQYRMGPDFGAADPLSLEGLLEKSARDDFYPITLEAFTNEGQLRAIPLGFDMTVMYYNKTLFNAQNVPYPQTGWTWAEFVETGEQLTNADAGMFGFAAQSIGSGTFMELMTFLYQHGGQLFDDLDNPQRMVFATPANVEALTWYASLFNERQIAPRVGQLSPLPYPSEGIRQGRYAMWHGMLGEYSDYADALGRENLGMVALPRDVNGASFGYAIGLYISSESLSPEASWEWVNFLSQQGTFGLFPARRSIAESATYAATIPGDFLSAAKATIGDVRIMRFNMSDNLNKKWGMATSAWETAIAEIRNGENVQAALDKAEKKAGQ